MSYAKSVSIRPLRKVRLIDAPEVGGKAANLGELMAIGMRVPDGLVVANCTLASLAEHLDAIAVAVQDLGDGPFAVRSSAVGEDGAEQSFAGIFTSLLNVGPDEIGQAVDQVLASANAERATGYEAAGEIRMAVIIQQMIQPATSGVALTADPIDGNRRRCVITAARGTGDRLVSGEVMGDEWTVIDGKATERRRDEGAIDGAAAETVDQAARQIADAHGTPQDIEWAIDAQGVLWIVQARPMTALPPEVSWEPPADGAFSRTFRLGEWISGPVSPLFESWLLPVVERELLGTLQEWVGMPAPEPHHVVVNGWCFHSLNWLSPTAGMASMPGILKRFVQNPRRILVIRPETAHHSISLYEREWREELAPRYREAVASAESRVDALPAEELPSIIDQLGALAGEYFASIAALAGAGYKFEMSLAKTYRRYLGDSPGNSYLPLLAGFTPPASLKSHAVTSLDWLLEPGNSPAPAETFDHGAVVAAREEAERTAFDALASSPRRLKRFKKTLEDAQRMVPLREEQVSDFTLAWPVMRRAVLRIGESLVESNIIAIAEDVFFLTRDEVTRSLAGATAAVDVNERRTLLAEQARLVPPMIVGKLNPIAARMWDQYTALIDGTPSPTAIVTGGSASPGQATGVVRVIMGPDAFDELLPGEILVAPVTAPAWTPLFTRAAAVVTDVGSVAAHASIIAREYGIPAVVGCGDATARLRTGMRVTVDGTTGNVEPAPAART